MVCENGSFANFIFLLGAILFLSVSMLLIFRIITISALSDIGSAKSIIPRRLFVLGDMFAFRAVIYSFGSRELSNGKRVLIFINAISYVSSFACAIALGVAFLRGCN